MAFLSGIRPVLVAIWGCVAIFFGYLYVSLEATYQEVSRNLETSATSYVRLLEERASANIRGVRNFMGVGRHVYAYYLNDKSADRREKANTRLANVLTRQPQASALSIVDANGHVLLSSHPSARDLSLQNAPLFKTAMSLTGNDMLATNVGLDPVTGQMGLGFAFPLLSELAPEKGAIITNIPYDKFLLTFTQTLDLPPGFSLYIIDNSGRVLLGHPDKAAQINLPFEHALPPLADNSDHPTRLMEDPPHDPSGSDADKTHLHYVDTGKKSYLMALRHTDFVDFRAVVLVDRAVGMKHWHIQLERAIMGAVMMFFMAAYQYYLFRRKTTLKVQLADKALKLSIALKAAKSGIWEWNALNDELRLGPEFHELLAMEVLPRTGEEWLENILPSDCERIRPQLKEAFSKKTDFLQIEFRALSNKGPRWVAVMGQINFDPVGWAVGATGVCIDISRNKAAELEMAQARDLALQAQAKAEEALEARARFMAAANHDLRQPVQSLMLLLEVLKHKDLTEDVKILTHNMESALEGMRLLLKGIQDVSRLQAGVIQPIYEEFSLNDMLDDFRREYSLRAKERNILLEVRPTRLGVTSDPVLLQRIIRNLVENALRYTKEGWIHVGVRERGPWVRIDVMDTGIGIAPQDRDRIFEEYQQVGNAERDSRKGLGLGLYVVKCMAELLGGCVEVKSILGKGSRFSVWVPRTKDLCILTSQREKVVTQDDQPKNMPDRVESQSG